MAMNTRDRVEKTCETFDIVMHRKSDIGQEHVVKPLPGINPGCQDIPFEEVEFIKSNIFDKIACTHEYIVEVIRKVHVWCSNCGRYVGYIQMPYKLERFDYKKRLDVTDATSFESYSLRCDGCYFHTHIAIKDLITI